MDGWTTNRARPGGAEGVSVMGLVLALLLVADWVALVPTVSKHVPRIEISKGGETGVCSAVVFEVDKDGYGHALTAAHCVERASDTERIDITVNGRNGVTVARNNILDLAILKFRARSETAITIASTGPLAGAEVAAIGYGFGIEEFAVQFGHIAQPLNRETKAMWVDLTALMGDSGGPIVNAQGELIGITSRIYAGGMLSQMAHITAAVPLDSLRDFIDSYQAERAKERK